MIAKLANVSDDESLKCKAVCLSLIADTDTIDVETQVTLTNRFASCR